MVTWQRIKKIVPLFKDRPTRIRKDRSQVTSKHVTSRKNIGAISSMRSQKSPSNPKSVKQT